MRMGSLHLGHSNGSVWDTAREILNLPARKKEKFVRMAF